MSALSDSSDESDAEPPEVESRENSNRGTPTQADPLDVRFSQKKMRHMFVNGNIVADVAPLVQTVRCSEEEETRLGARWKLVAPFPVIEVVRWRCKLRDERTGRPIVDPQTGMTLYDSEERLFTLDHRRLYCLQLAATRVWPDRCAVEVSELPPGAPDRMHEVKKFKTLDRGKSIMVGSAEDNVPFVRWAWRTELQVPDEDELEDSAKASTEPLQVNNGQPHSVSKHVLHRPWRLWLQQLADNASPFSAKAVQPGTKWHDGQQLVHAFDTVEDFWCLTHFSRMPSSFSNADLSLFESNVTLAGEDPRFKRGGCWLMKLAKIQAPKLDNIWLLLNMALIGEGFNEVGGDLVRGATISLRTKASKVALWLEQAHDQNMVMAIGREFQRVLADALELRDSAPIHLTFESFQAKRVTLELGEAETTTVGVFQ